MQTYQMIVGFVTLPLRHTHPLTTILVKVERLGSKALHTGQFGWELPATDVAIELKMSETGDLTLHTLQGLRLPALRCMECLVQFEIS
ncbi:hypothetical protein EVAR_5419_1 [Eumeta japonica]|uniref:Uncharacterized protein n=1 Tax=Eumeta variegata TaxID=151549 RepID=A0A4C1T9L8_EUMVA|nr:hypothetical protein EVAR_5419_1 [Eumeta japonica]